MTTSGHTPGPWFEDEAGICAAGRLVAIVALPDECCGADPDSLHDSVRAELSANARLIAAAPDLLGALEGACDVLEAVSGQVEGASFALTEARAALLQAWGEAG